MENNEEWNNFMHRVSEISQIVSQLSSGDKSVSERGQKLADVYLSEGGQDLDLDGEIKMKIKSNRTVINEKACHKVERPANSNEMDPETFMKEAGRDADQRAADRKIREEKAETFKTRATKAFRRGDYELALTCYNNAIEHVRTSCLLYTNRALTFIKLDKLDKVLADCERALRLNENSFKAQLYQTKAHKGLENTTEFKKCYDELVERFPQHREQIDEFLKDSENEDEG